MNKHDPNVLAYHEAGHAIISILVGWGDKIDEVVITPEDPKQGGYIKLNNHSGKAPKGQILMEIAKSLAGPVSQVIFADSTIREPYKSNFRSSITGNIKTIDDLNAANCSGWHGDLSQYLGRVALSLEGACDDFLVVESFLRKWLIRPSVSKGIHVIASELQRRSPIAGSDIIMLVEDLLDSSDFVTEEDIKNAD